MKTGISLSAPTDVGYASAVAQNIVEIFAAGHEYRMDQDTVRHALNVLQAASSISNTSISGCSISG